MTNAAGRGTRTCQASPRLWRMAVIAIGMLILCSCRGPVQRGAIGSGTLAVAPGPGSPALPQPGYAGARPASAPGAAPVAIGPPGMEAGVPLPQAVTGPWVPPGMSPPWPRDEYLADGGDAGQTAVVDRDWEIHGLEPEDTVAHYDTLDGRRLVEASNRVHIYSPRFGAVRHVVSLRQDEAMKGLADVDAPVKVVQHEDLLGPQSRQQNVQAERRVGVDLANQYRTRQGDGVTSTAAGLGAFQNGFQPYEDLAAIRQGIFEAPEMARLAQSVAAAVAWSHRQAVQVQLDHQAAAADTGVDRLATVYTVKSRYGSSKLRITKVASASYAEPGDVVDFTLRFDNVGTELIGNVTIIDNLTTRLEYVADTAQCSVPGQFSTQPNEGDSLVLRWEITDPLKPGDGGVIRFRCRVR